MELYSVLEAACRQISTGDKEAARTTISQEAPFQPYPREKRKYSDGQALAVFRRDGFIDRYSGTRLVFPGTLRLLSLYLPTEFPFHPNWHMAHTHFAYWLLCPTLDHLVPVVRGGVDAEVNWVTTSQLRNSAKGHWLLEELGWQLHPPGRIEDWDGLLGWFLQQVQTDPSVASNPYVRRWQRAAVKHA